MVGGREGGMETRRDGGRERGKVWVERWFVIDLRNLAAFYSPQVGEGPCIYRNLREGGEERRGVVIDGSFSWNGKSCYVVVQMLCWTLWI